MERTRGRGTGEELDDLDDLGREREGRGVWSCDDLGRLVRSAWCVVRGAWCVVDSG